MVKLPFRNAHDLRAPPMPISGATSVQRTSDHYEDDVSESDFHTLAQLVERHSGIHLPPSKRSMVSSRLRICARRAGLHSMRDYCRYLFDQGGLDTEWPVILDAITTNKTDFFRERDHFSFLIDEAVPELLSTGQTDLAVWSAACSTGPEAYTLAMVLEQATQNQRFSYQVYASDICCEALEKAERGIYAAELVTPVPPALYSRYIMTSRNKSANLVRMAPELRRMVIFGHHNLLSPRSPWGRIMDVIFCRNVLIYFTRPTQELVVRHLCNQLRIGGYLFLGHSESMMALSLPIEQVRPSVYRRVP